MMPGVSAFNAGSDFLPSGGPAISPEEYQIYSIILIDRFSWSAREQFVIRQDLFASPLLIRGKDATVHSRIQEWRLKLTGLAEETARDFLDRSNQRASLEPNFDLALPYVLLSESESAGIWNWRDESTLRGQARDGWKVFRERYPNAGPIITFSRIGFDRAKTQALVEIGVRAHWVMGGGSLLLLQNEGVGWRIEKVMDLWIS